MDHNFDLLKSASNNTTNQFLDMNIDKDLTPCITKLTRVTKKNSYTDRQHINKQKVTT